MLINLDICKACPQYEYKTKHAHICNVGLERATRERTLVWRRITETSQVPRTCIMKFEYLVLSDNMYNDKS